MSMRVSAMCVAVLCALVAAARAAEAEGEARRALLAPAAFELESTLQLNDAARTDREAGYKLRARLSVAPRWTAPDRSQYLLHFQLQSPKLYLRGKHVNADFMPHESVWDSHSDSTFYAHWSSGEIKAAYLDPDELPDILNYKKSLLSLFQVQMLDGEYNETDVSGPCRVLYETISTEVFRKIKRGCTVDGAGGVTSARRVARYTLRAGQLAALHAEELLLLGPAALGLKARSWHTLTRDAAPAPAPAPAASLQDALHKLPPALRDLSLELRPPPEDAADDDEELSAVLEQSRAALEGEAPGEGGTAAGAAAALQLLPALRRANHSAALQLLQRADLHDQLSGLCRMLGLAGTRASHRAADDFLQLGAADPLADLAHVYLAAFALAPRPDEAAVLDVLRLGQAARAPAVRRAALLAAAAAARACPAAAPAVRDALLRGLQRCGDAACRAAALRALAHVPAAAPELLLAHAAREDAAEALAALAALEGAPLSFARLDRLQALALNASLALEVRAAALELLVRRRAAVPSPLARADYALYLGREHELRRVLWQRAASLADEHSALAALRSQLEPLLRGWDARAAGGTSAVLAREPGWSLGGWRARLLSVQVARGGLLRRGEVRLQALDEHGNVFDALAVEVWTRGLEAFGGASGDASAESDAQTSQPAEEPAGGLGLAVGGARMPDVALFRGQAELLGHVWAGTASSPTPVLRALRPLLEHAAHVPLLAGAHARARAGAALALALDAQAQVSLWWRSARAELRLRAGLAARAALRVRTAWAALDASADVRVEPRLRIAADLDFYSTVALCVRVSTEAHEVARTVALRAEGGARRLRVRRERVARVAVAGRTLALGRPNDATCRTLRAADADADADVDADTGTQ